MRNPIPAVRLSAVLFLSATAGCTLNGGVDPIRSASASPCPERTVYTCVEASSLIRSCTCTTRSEMKLLLDSNFQQGFVKRPGSAFAR